MFKIFYTVLNIVQVRYMGNSMGMAYLVYVLFLFNLYCSLTDELPVWRTYTGR